jgi:hypothetical protein
LDGWNSIPIGYGATFDVAAAPLWLRLLFQAPFVDRFAYPLLVKRGLGMLSPHPGWPSERLGPVTAGWRVADV